MLWLGAWWIDVYPNVCRQMASLGHYELTDNVTTTKSSEKPRAYFVWCKPALYQPPDINRKSFHADRALGTNFREMLSKLKLSIYDNAFENAVCKLSFYLDRNVLREYALILSNNTAYI